MEITEIKMLIDALFVEGVLRKHYPLTVQDFFNDPSSDKALKYLQAENAHGRCYHAHGGGMSHDFFNCSIQIAWNIACEVLKTNKTTLPEYLDKTDPWTKHLIPTGMVFFALYPEEKKSLVIEKIARLRNKFGVETIPLFELDADDILPDYLSGIHGIFTTV